MKAHFQGLLVLSNCLAALAHAATTNSPVIFPGDTAQSLKLVWPATHGVRYHVQQSTNLQTWTASPGYPAAADGPAQQMIFPTTNKGGFFKVRELDEQPPTIVRQYPRDAEFAVPRFADLFMELSDVTGIDTNSIRLTVGSLGTFALTDAQLTFTNNLLTFHNGVGIPLGDWGSNVVLTLVIADVLGNATTNTTTFSLEVQPQVVLNLFVFGSPQARSTGQQIGSIPTRALAEKFGSVPMGAADPWSLELVESNRLELSYANAAPGFATNTYVCNLTPVRPAEIFNRKITSISDDPASKRLTLFTLEVPINELATNASVTLSDDSRLIETGANGAFVQVLSIDRTLPFPRIGYSLDGAGFSLKNTNGFNIASLTLEKEHWWLTPRLQVSLEINGGGLKRFESIARGSIESASIWEVDFLLAGVAVEKTLFELTEAEKLRLKKWMLLGYAGPVPVFASLAFDVSLKGRAEVNSTLNFRVGKHETTDAVFGVTCQTPATPRFVQAFIFAPPEVVPFTAGIDAQGSVKLSLEPAVEVLVYGLAGVSARLTPSAAVVFEGSPGQPLTGRLEADVSLGLGLAGPAFDRLNPKPELRAPLWSDQWHLFPNETLRFTFQPQDQTVRLGSSAYFSCSVASSNPPAYQWFFNSVPLPGQRARTLSIPNIGYGHAGNYSIHVSADGQTMNSASAQLTVVPANLPSGMALVPAGTFTMGSDEYPGFGEQPTHSVYVSAFYMDQYDVTHSLWQSVYSWAVAHGYSFDHPGLANAGNHPVHTIDWFDAVKWCNARSEMEGRTPAYYTSAAQTTVYRTGQVTVDNSSVKWDSGYRLPTEAEWEKAARGGSTGLRFPWGNTISWSEANYFASPRAYVYDVNPTAGFDPAFEDESNAYTSPVGYFPPNGYGLYDMAGNVWQWCWDWYDYRSYSSASPSDPHGPTSGLGRVCRGGAWGDNAFNCRAAVRFDGDPTRADDFCGFRCVLSPERCDRIVIQKACPFFQAR